MKTPLTDEFEKENLLNYYWEEGEGRGYDRESGCWHWSGDVAEFARGLEKKLAEAKATDLNHREIARLQLASQQEEIEKLKAEIKDWRVWGMSWGHQGREK